MTSLRVWISDDYNGEIVMIVLLQNQRSRFSQSRKSIREFTLIFTNSKRISVNSWRLADRNIFRMDFEKAIHQRLTYVIFPVTVMPCRMQVGFRWK